MTDWRPAGDRRLRVGLAGLGSMGRNHLRILAGRNDITLAAVADPVAEALEGATAQSSAQAFAEPLAMIAEAELDAVVIAAPTTTHVPLAVAAIERGIAVLVEKPLAATVDDGIAIVAAARAYGVPVQVGHVERFNPGVLELGRLIGEGWLSAVYAMASRRAGPFPARIRDVGVTDRPRHPRRRHPVVDRRGAAVAGLRRDGPADPRRPRGPAVRPAPFPVRRDRHARRQLADAGQAAPARRRRRRGDVRARLPHPAPDVHAGQPTRPTLD